MIQRQLLYAEKRGKGTSAWNGIKIANAPREGGRAGDHGDVHIE